ncbi:MAG: hypothetical protein GX442_18565 [Candidatus Riflebacteria bacterium]|nr:hypothetical protein [Candidatus Riflebacteria bacterium]
MKTPHSTPRVTGKTVLVLALLSLYSGLWGCGQASSPTAPSAPGLAVVSGTVPAGRTGSLVFRVAGSTAGQEVPVGADGRFSVRLPSGRYSVLLKNASGSLTLVKRSLEVEDDLTISLLDVALVPIPTVISVAVPLAGARDAFIEWETDVESEGRIDYGLDASYGYSTHTDSAMSKTHRLQLLGLQPSTSYHFRIVVGRHGLDEVQTYSPDYFFSTEPPGQGE